MDTWVLQRAFIVVIVVANGLAAGPLFVVEDGPFADLLPLESSGPAVVEKPRYRPQVIGCLDGLITNYLEARRLALAERKELVVLVEQPASVRADQCGRYQGQAGVVLCLATREDGFAAPGIYHYWPRVYEGSFGLWSEPEPARVEPARPHWYYATSWRRGGG